MFDRLFGFNTTQKKTLERLEDSILATAAGTLPSAATTSTAGTVKQAAAVTDVTPATDGTAVGTAFNDLLAKLRTAGILDT